MNPRSTLYNMALASLLKAAADGAFDWKALLQQKMGPLAKSVNAGIAVREQERTTPRRSTPPRRVPPPTKNY